MPTTTTTKPEQQTDTAKHNTTQITLHSLVHNPTHHEALGNEQLTHTTSAAQPVNIQPVRGTLLPARSFHKETIRPVALHTNFPAPLRPSYYVANASHVNTK